MQKIYFYLCKLVLRLWNSPTFTTWGNQAVQAMRLLAITPLVLIYFNTTEIAAWYLFSSLVFIGSIISQRVGLTFTRMVSFAMGGATNLAPIKTRQLNRENTEPNWNLVQKVYQTTGALNAILSAIIMLSALALGCYGLENLLSEYEDSKNVWCAFLVMILTQAAVFFFQKYTIVLRGMNYVALSNRWNVLFSLLSVTVGVIALKTGGGILVVTIAMQTVILLSILRNRYLVRWVEGGRVKKFSTMKVDTQVLVWAWEPAWKGFIVTMANSGSIQVAAVFSARFLPVAEAASLLISIRLLTAMKSVCDAPYMSHMPLISKLLSQGQIEQLGKMVPLKFFYCQALFAVSVLALSYLGSGLLSFIGSDVVLINRDLLLLMGLLLLLHNLIRLSLIFSAFGNHVVCVQRELWAFLASVLSMYLFLPMIGIYGLLVGLFLPSFIILNIVPTKILSDKLDVSLSYIIITTTLLPAFLVCLGYFLSIISI